VIDVAAATRIPSKGSGTRFGSSVNHKMTSPLMSAQSLEKMDIDARACAASGPSSMTNLKTSEALPSHCQLYRGKGGLRPMARSKAI